MFQELKKKTLKTSLVLSVILILIGLGLAGFMATNMYYVVFGYADFEQLEPDEIKNQLVDFDMTTNFGCYLEEYEYNEDTKRSRTTDLYYIIWTGDDYVDEFCYMTVKVPPSMENEMEEMSENTYNELLSDPITVHGKIKKLDKEEYEYFVETFEEAGWSDKDIEEGTLPYYIDTFEKKSTANAGYIFIFALGMLFLIWGIVRIAKAAKGGYLKKLQKDIADGGYSESTIESDYRTAASLHNKSLIKVGRLMTYYTAGSDIRAIPNNKMVWAYMNTITHRTNGIKTGTTYNVNIEVDGSKKSHVISMPNEATALAMLEKLNTMFPWVVVGFSDQLKTMYNKNRDEFLALRYNTCEHVAVEPGFENFYSQAEQSEQ